MELNWRSHSLTGTCELDVATQFVEQLQAQEFMCHGPKSGLYFMTNTAGAHSSVALWANALEHSPRFANPAIFPFTLSNAVPGLIARSFSIEGPCYTLVDAEGNNDQMMALYQADQQQYGLESGLLVFWCLSIDHQITVHVKFLYLS